ncbi:MAG: hypothetical protein U0166_15035 [Acidobacteriota bacterium]
MHLAGDAERFVELRARLGVLPLALGEDAEVPAHDALAAAIADDVPDLEGAQQVRPCARRVAEVEQEAPEVPGDDRFEAAVAHLPVDLERLLEEPHRVVSPALVLAHQREIAEGDRLVTAIASLAVRDERLERGARFGETSDVVEDVAQVAEHDTLLEPPATRSLQGHGVLQELPRIVEPPGLAQQVGQGRDGERVTGAVVDGDLDRDGSVEGRPRLGDSPRELRHDALRAQGERRVASIASLPREREEPGARGGRLGGAAEDPLDVREARHRVEVDAGAEGKVGREERGGLGQRETLARGSGGPLVAVARAIDGARGLPVTAERILRSTVSVDLHEGLGGGTVKARERLPPDPRDRALAQLVVQERDRPRRGLVQDAPRSRLLERLHRGGFGKPESCHEPRRDLGVDLAAAHRERFHDALRAGRDRGDPRLDEVQDRPGGGERVRAPRHAPAAGGPRDDASVHGDAKVLRCEERVALRLRGDERAEIRGRSREGEHVRDHRRHVRRPEAPDAERLHASRSCQVLQMLRCLLLPEGRHDGDRRCCESVVAREPAQELDGGIVAFVEVVDRDHRGTGGGEREHDLHETPRAAPGRPPPEGGRPRSLAGREARAPARAGRGRRREGRGRGRPRPGRDRGTARRWRSARRPCLRGPPLRSRRSCAARRARRARPARASSPRRSLPGA